MSEFRKIPNFHKMSAFFQLVGMLHEEILYTGTSFPTNLIFGDSLQ